MLGSFPISKPNRLLPNSFAATAASLAAAEVVVFSNPIQYRTFQFAALTKAATRL